MNRVLPLALLLAVATVVLLTAAVLLLGCTQMSNDQVISEVKKCRDAGLCPERLVNGWNFKTTAIQCKPCEEDR